MAKSDRQIKGWFTTKSGKHIPIFEGETKADVVKRMQGGKSDPKSDSKKTQSTQSEKTQKKSDSSVKKTDTKQTKSEAPKSKSETQQKSWKTDDIVSKKESQIKKSSENIKSLNDEEKYRDTLKNNGKVTLKNGKMQFNGKDVQDINLAEAGTVGKDSLADYVRDGKLMPERQEVHRQIIENYFKGHQPYAPGEEKVVMFTGGGGASGKGRFSKDIDAYYSQNKNPMVLDADEIKKQLAAVDGNELNDKLTGYYHEESSALVKQIYNTAIENNYPMMFDGTSTNVGSTLKKLQYAEQHGYKSEMCFIFSDWATVRQNSLDRYSKSGRLVPLMPLLKAHMMSYPAVEALQDKFDSFKLFDNAGRNLRMVGESSGKKPLKISNQASWNRFKKVPSEFEISQAEIDKYFEDVKKIKEERERQHH